MPPPFWAICAWAKISTTPPLGTLTVTDGPPRSAGVFEVVALEVLTTLELMKLAFAVVTAPSLIFPVFTWPAPMSWPLIVPLWMSGLLTAPFLIAFEPTLFARRCEAA